MWMLYTEELRILLKKDVVKIKIEENSLPTLYISVLFKFEMVPYYVYYYFFNDRF